MKKFTMLLLILMLSLSCVFAGSWTNNAEKVTGFAGEKQGRMLVFTCSVDSIDTLTSNTFSLAKYDGYKELYSAFTLDQDIVSTGGTDPTKVPLLDSTYVTISMQSIEVPYAYIATSSAGSPKLTVYVQGSYDESNWFDVDTICTNMTSESLAKGTAQLFRYHVPYYRVVVYGVALNRSDTVFDLRFYLYWGLDKRDR